MSYHNDLERVLTGKDEFCTLPLDNTNHFIREQRASNSFFITEAGHLVTPPLSSEILDGVTRDSILKIGTDLIEEGRLKGVYEAEIPAKDLAAMREAFACGTGVTLAPIGSITDREDRFEMNVSEEGIGPLSKLIRDRLTQVMRGEHKGAPYKDWLHEVKQRRD